MADPTMTLMEIVRWARVNLNSDVLSQGTQSSGQLAIKFEVEQRTGVDCHEQSPSRPTCRTGHREWAWEARTGEIPLHIPKLRVGSLFLSFMEPRRRAEKALLAIVQEANIQGTPVDGPAAPEQRNP